MRRTANPLSLLLLSLALACILSTTGCKTASKPRALPQLAPEPPQVRCKQADGPLVPREPKADEWIEWIPPKPGMPAGGEARLSQKAVNFVIDLYTTIRIDRGLRSTEHACLDEHEAKGLIRQ